jgi:hypothetical protein
MRAIERTPRTPFIARKPRSFRVSYNSNPRRKNGIISMCLPARYALLFLMALTTTAVAAPDEVRIYEPGTLTSDRYQIVARLWVESWRSAFQVPTHAARAEAVEALKAEAVQRGANALTNLSCLTDDAPFPGSGPHFCYALAVRTK